MAKRRDSVDIGEFLTENNRDGIDHKRFSRGHLRRARNYHFRGVGELQSREGHGPITTTQPNGNNAVNGMRLFEGPSSNDLLVVVGGQVRKYDGADAFSDVTNGQTIASGQDKLIRSAYFEDNTEPQEILCDQTNAIIKYDGTQCEAVGGSPPANPVDVASFREHMFVGNGNIDIDYCQAGDIDTWPTGNNLRPERNSVLKAIVPQGRDDGLIFLYKKAIHRCFFEYRNLGSTVNLFQTQPIAVGEQFGCESTFSAVSKDGIVYWANRRGIFMLDPESLQPVKISWPIDKFWSSIKTNRIELIEGQVGPAPYDDIIWKVTTGTSTKHNAMVVYNPTVGGWAVFTSATGGLELNCGTTYRDSDGDEISVFGTYDGFVHKGFGDGDDHSSGYYSDNGEAIENEIRTGMVLLNRRNWKGLRQVGVRLSTTTNHSFSLQVTPLGQTAYDSKALSVGAQGAVLSVDFMLGSSLLSSGEDSPQEPIWDYPADGRWFQFKLTHSSATKVPHFFHGFLANYRTKGSRAKR